MTADRTADRAETLYKGYVIRPLRRERGTNALGYPYPVMTYMVYSPDGEGVAKAWGMIEAKAIVNADLRGELR